METDDFNFSFDFDYDRFKTVPYWPDLPAASYAVASSGWLPDPTSLTAQLRASPAAWNLFWAVAEREPGEHNPILLRPLDLKGTQALFRLPGYKFTSDASGQKWTLSAWMCHYTPEQFMSRFWPSIAPLLQIPEAEGHVFSNR